MDPAMLTLAALLACLTAGALVLICSSVFELRQTAKASDYKRHPYRRLYRRRPLIEVVLPADNPVLLYECLLSLAGGQYRKVQVVLVGRQNSEVKIQADKFKSSYPSIKIRSLNKQAFNRQAGRGRAELRVHLSRPVVLANDSLKATALIFAADNRLQAITPEILVQGDYSFSNLMARFGGLLRAPARRAAGLFGLYNKAPEAVIYRSSMGKKVSFGRGIRVQYSPAVVFYATTYNKPLKSALTPINRSVWARSIKKLTTLFAALSLLLAGYAVYLAFWEITAVPLFLLWAGLALYLCLSAIQAERLSLLTKARFIVLAPILCVPFYIWSLLSGALVLRNLMRL